jgi:hypothetical protein
MCIQGYAQQATSDVQRRTPELFYITVYPTLDLQRAVPMIGDG